VVLTLNHTTARPMAAATARALGRGARQPRQSAGVAAGSAAGGGSIGLSWSAVARTGSTPRPSPPSPPLRSPEPRRARCA